MIAAHLETNEALVRLDERARHSRIRDGWAARLLYRNACASLDNRGSLVFVEDLVLLDGHAFAGRMSADLSEALATLQLWQRALRGQPARLMTNSMPGEDERPLSSTVRSGQEGANPETIYDPDYNQAGRLARWRDVYRATAAMPPLLAAATAWDAWHSLCPEPQGPWRALLLASLGLAACGTVRGWLPPLDWGEQDCRKKWRPTDSEDQRRLVFLAIVAAATARASRELDALISVRDRLRLRLKDASKTSHLPELIDLVIAKPLISIPLAAKALGITKQAVASLLPQLGPSLREITDRKRYRCWTVP